MERFDMKNVLILVVFVLSLILIVSCGEEEINITAPDQEVISKIEIRIGINGESLKLTKVQEDDWSFAYREEQVITGEANTNTIKQILRELDKLRISSDRIASRNTDNYFKYGVDEDSAIYLKIYTTEDEEHGYTFIIGKSDIDRKFTFVRIPDKEPVYRAYGNYRNVLNKRLMDFRDRSIFEYNFENIEKIEYMDEDGNMVTLNKKEIPSEEVELDNEEQTEMEEEKEMEFQWIRESDGKVYITDKVNSAVEQISRLSASSFIDYPSDDIINIEPIFKVTYYEKVTMGGEYTLNILKLVPKDDVLSDVNQDTYLVQKGNQTNPLYLASKSIIDRLMKIRQADEEDKPVEDENA